MTPRITQRTESVVAWSPIVRDLYRRLRRAERLSFERISDDPNYFDERPLFSREQWGVVCVSGNPPRTSHTCRCEIHRLRS
jgi:hypothetical protein